MDPTDKFRRALPPAFFAASPPLAALHTARARLLPPHPPQDSSACSRCGSFLLRRSTHRPRQSARHLLSRSCPTCGSTAVSPLPTAAFPQTRHHHSSAPSLPQQPTTPPSIPHPPTATKSRPKNKSGLQHLLARNRENQQKEHKKEHESGGLAAFLTGL